MAIPTIKTFSTIFQDELNGVYPLQEIQALLRIALEHVLKMSFKDLVSSPDTKIPISSFKTLNNILRELKNNKPIQYIIGKADFYGLVLHVNGSVLIPRQETEELVHHIINASKKKNSISLIDIGTGSGCIAISLKKNMPMANVSALDISEEALVIAKLNAVEQNTEITFVQADILKLPQLKTQYNLIVSNPPYIPQNEQLTMHPNVLNYEPHLALFVSKNDPLVFYKAIMEFAINHFTDGGELWFEIHEHFAPHVQTMMIEYNFSGVEIIKDIHDKNRIVKGVWMHPAAIGRN